MICSAGMDGKLNIIDVRTHKVIFNQVVHSGSIGFVEMSQSSTLVTGSADSSLLVLDSYQRFQQICKLKATGSVLTGKILKNCDKNVCVVGCADGNVLAYDLDL